MKIHFLHPKFVVSAPDQLNDGVIYISEKYKTALHKCCCGCGSEVVTPLNESGWSYKNNDGIVTFKPSIGNYSLPCQSHYLIIKNEVVWAKKLTKKQIDAVKAQDLHDQLEYIEKCNQETIQIIKPTKDSWASKMKNKINRWMS